MHPAVGPVAAVLLPSFLQVFPKFQHQAALSIVDIYWCAIPLILPLRGYPGSLNHD